MKARVLVILCSILVVAGCSSISKTNTAAEAAPSATATKKNSIYDGVSAAKVKECMGAPVSTFSANNDSYLRYFSPNHCEVLFIVDNTSQKVVDMKYLLPHGFTRFGYAVNEKKCPLTQKQCLLS